MAIRRISVRKGGDRDTEPGSLASTSDDGIEAKKGAAGGKGRGSQKGGRSS